MCLVVIPLPHPSFRVSNNVEHSFLDITIPVNFFLPFTVFTTYFLVRIWTFAIGTNLVYCRIFLASRFYVSCPFLLIFLFLLIQFCGFLATCLHLFLSPGLHWLPCPFLFCGIGRPWLFTFHLPCGRRWLFLFAFHLLCTSTPSLFFLHWLYSVAMGFLAFCFLLSLWRKFFVCFSPFIY